ncbi:hypothetical protein [Bacteroides sp.]|uniref:hypothetical protein n=1 Tax=Bacteroides sp. TaxID=29523 RepID=UPI002A828589|nr:hypothetical protein [Bacteroides sp.]
MKRNLLYLAGFLLAAATIFSGCNDEDPSYHNLVTDTQELIINFDEAPQGTIQVLQGNGNYKIVSSNEEVATAVAEGNMIKVTALKAGITNLTITDWAQMSTNVKVIVDQLSELVLAVSSTKMYLGENKVINIHTGNRGYKVTVDKESIAKATVDEEGHIQVESLAPGIATVTVTDRLNKTAELSVKVVKQLVLDNSEEIAYLTIGEPLILKILDGNGEYTCVNNGSATYLKCTMAENGTDVVVEGLKRYRFNKTITISDQEGESISINVVYIDDPYLTNPSYRYFIAGSASYQSLSTSAVGTVTHAAEFNMSELVIKGTGTYASGFAIQFTGDLTVGDKSNAVLYKVTRNAIDKSVKYPAENCRIDKVENDWYWVSFTEPNCTARSYFITKQ